MASSNDSRNLEILWLRLVLFKNSSQLIDVHRCKFKVLDLIRLSLVEILDRVVVVNPDLNVSFVLWVDVSSTGALP